MRRQNASTTEARLVRGVARLSVVLSRASQSLSSCTTHPNLRHSGCSSLTRCVCVCWRACVCVCGTAPAPEYHIHDSHIPLVLPYHIHTCCECNVGAIVLMCTYAGNCKTCGCNWKKMVAIALSCVAIMETLMTDSTHGCNCMTSCCNWKKMVAIALSCVAIMATLMTNSTHGCNCMTSCCDALVCDVTCCLLDRLLTTALALASRLVSQTVFHLGRPS